MGGFLDFFFYVGLIIGGPIACLALGAAIAEGLVTKFFVHMWDTWLKIIKLTTPEKKEKTVKKIEVVVDKFDTFDFPDFPKSYEYFDVETSGFKKDYESLKSDHGYSSMIQYYYNTHKTTHDDNAAEFLKMLGMSAPPKAKPKPVYTEKADGYEFSEAEYEEAYQTSPLQRNFWKNVGRKEVAPKQVRVAEALEWLCEPGSLDELRMNNPVVLRKIMRTLKEEGEV